jgi:tetratricopeptide (TPR) repeat protein
LSRPPGTAVKAARCAALLLAAAASAFLAYYSIRHGMAAQHADQGWKRLREGQTAAAVGLFLRAEALVPGTTRACSGLGEAYLALYRKRPGATELLDRAAKFFALAVADSPADLGAAIRLSYVGLLRNRQEPAAAAAEFDRAAGFLRMQPRLTFMRRAFMDLALDAARIPGTRVILYRDPRRREAVIQAGGMLLVERRLSFFELAPLLDGELLEPDEVLRLVGASVGPNRDLAAWLARGGGWESRGERFLEAAAALERKGFAAGVAEALRRAGKPDAALDLLEAQVLREPDDAELRFLLGQSREKLGRLAEARGDYARAASLAPRVERYREALRRVSPVP